MNKTITFSLFFGCYILFGKAFDSDSARDISDTTIKKQYIDSDYLFESGTQILVGWDYQGGAIYSVDMNNIEDNRKYDLLFEEDDKYFFSTKVLNLDEYEQSIILAGGYFSKCLCGILLRKSVGEEVWTKIYFDELDNPYVSNINCISTNSGVGDKFGGSFSRVFLGCNNGSILFSDDSARTFNLSEIYIGAKNVTRIHFFDERIGYALIGTNESTMNQMYFTNDYGESWKSYHDFSSLGVTFKDFILSDFESDSSVSMCLIGSRLDEGIILNIPNVDKPDENYFLENESSTGKDSPFIGVVLSEHQNRLFILDENGALYGTNGNKTYIRVLQAPNDNYLRIKFNTINAVNGNTYVGIGFDGIVYKYVSQTTDIMNSQMPNETKLVYSNISETLQIIDENNSDIHSIQIVNIFGSIVVEFNEILNNNSSLQFSEYPNNIYFYRIFTENAIFCGKFITY